MEKLIETMKGKEYSAIIIAESMSNDKVEAMCAEYEDIYSQLAHLRHRQDSQCSKYNYGYRRNC